MLGADDDDVPAVAIGDDLVLQVLRRVAPVVSDFERRAQLRALAPQRLADVAQRRAGRVGDVAGRAASARRTSAASRRERRRPRGDRLQQFVGRPSAAAAVIARQRRSALRVRRMPQRPRPPTRESARGRAAAAAPAVRRRCRDRRGSPARSSGASRASDPPRLRERHRLAGQAGGARRPRPDRPPARAPARARARAGSRLRAPAPPGCDRTRAPGERGCMERPSESGAINDYDSDFARDAAAPKPLSMLTTATPVAHELSIASSAVRPPKLAP